MIERVEKLLHNTIITPTVWLIGITGILITRFFLEAISSPTSSGVIASDSSTLIHYYVFFISFALGALIFFWFALPKWRDLVPQLVLYIFSLVLIAPIIDFILSRGAGSTMTYLFLAPKELFHSLLTYFGPGITVGIRIEALIIIILSGFLIWKVQKSVAHGIVSAVILYIAIFVFVSLPSIITLFNTTSPALSFWANSIAKSATFANNLHSTLIYSSGTRALEIGFNFAMGKIWFLFASALALVYFLLRTKEKTVAIFKNSRPERVIFHLSTIAMGFGLAKYISPPQIILWSDALSIIVLLIAFYFAWMFEVAVNDIEDREIDEVSNTGRPLIKGKLDVNDLKQAAIIFLLAALVGGFLAGYYAFFCLLVFLATYYIYSVPSTRFKRIPFFSSFLIAICCLAELMAGFFLLSNSKELSVLPTRAVIAIIVLVFLWSHIRDLKDIDGDSKAGIPTVAVIFGKWGPTIVAAMAALTYLLIPLFLKMNILFLPAIPAALATYYFCVRKPYSERPIFATYFLFALISLLLIKPSIQSVF